MKLTGLGWLAVVLTAPMLASAKQRPAETAAAQIDRIMKARSAAGDFNGAVLVGREGHILYQRAFGFANLEWKAPNDLRTKFEIGSMTKQFTALLILQFVNEGKVKLDGRLSEYLPYYRQDTGKRVTISELLSHTSGIPSFTGLPGFLEGAASRTRYTVRELAQQYCSGDLLFEPGTKFDYSNSGYFLLGGAVLEQVSGVPYERLLQDRIFTPLMVSAPHAWDPDAIGKPRNLKPPHWKIVSGGEKVGSGENAVELYPLRGAATERQYMVYFRKWRLLYASDALALHADGTLYDPQLMNEVIQAVNRENLEVDAVFAMHQGPTPWKQVVAWVEKAKGQ